jgi:hypothetical protein
MGLAVLAVYSGEAGGSNPGAPVASCVEGHSSPGDPGMSGSWFIRYQPFSVLGIVRPQNRVSLGWMRTC